MEMVTIKGVGVKNEVEIKAPAGVVVKIGPNGLAKVSASTADWLMRTYNVANYHIFELTEDKEPALSPELVTLVGDKLAKKLSDGNVTTIKALIKRVNAGNLTEIGGIGEKSALEIKMAIADTITSEVNEDE